MTEAEWLECDDSRRMWIFLKGKTSERKQRLFAAACTRRIWNLITDQRSQAAVAVVERYADREASPLELSRAEELARAAVEDAIRNLPPIEDVIRNPELFPVIGDHISVRIGEMPGRARKVSYFTPASIAVFAAKTANFLGRNVGFEVAVLMDRDREREGFSAEFREQASAIRDLLGNPFRPVTFNPTWLRWNGGTVVALAQAAYDERHLPSGELDKQRLAILADALEDAGCHNADILEHLRGPGPHVRGCWVVDLLLQKT